MSTIFFRSNEFFILSKLFFCVVPGKKMEDFPKYENKLNYFLKHSKINDWMIKLLQTINKIPSCVEKQPDAIFEDP